MEYEKNPNMGIWERGRHIDQNYTKIDNSAGYTRTAINTEAVFEKITEEFGPCGKGWGYVIDLERFDEGGVAQPHVTFDNGEEQPEIRELTHTLLMTCWYMLDGEKITLPQQAGHTPYIYHTKYGATQDKEYYKKTISDGVKKSFSMLGIAADVFLGLYDDKNYIKFRQEEKLMEESYKAPEYIEQINKEVAAFRDIAAKAEYSNSLNAEYNRARAQVSFICKSKLHYDVNASSKYMDTLTHYLKINIERLNDEKAKRKAERQQTEQGNK